ncbi:MAG: hypothetical protein Q8Q62_03950, partial [Mesorhizobium sp.]|nr:hypothetical protein [Mesorhizobium sp.]
MADPAGGTGNRIMREARRILHRFRNTPPAGLARTLWRAARLGRRTFRQPTVPPREERVVVSLTTIPPRAGMLRPVLQSLIDQSVPADRIVLALPLRSRKGEPYPDPATLNLPAGIDAIRCDDEGPATKLLPALKLEPESVLIVVDDDVIYPYRFIETLLAAHRRNRRAALGFRGVRLSPGVGFPALDHVFATGVAGLTPVDVLFGTWGYLLP